MSYVSESILQVQGSFFVEDYEKDHSSIERKLHLFYHLPSKSVFNLSEVAADSFWAPVSIHSDNPAKYSLDNFFLEISAFEMNVFQMFWQKMESNAPFHPGQ